MKRHIPAPSMWLMCAMALSWPITINLFLPAIPAISDAFNAAPDRVQFAFSMGMLAFGCAQVVIGPMIDKLGRRPVLLTSLVIFVIGGAVGALAPALPMVTLGRVVQCVGVAALFVLARVRRCRGWPPSSPWGPW